MLVALHSEPKYRSFFNAVVSQAVAISILVSNVVLIWKLCQHFNAEEVTFEIKVVSACNLVFFAAFTFKAIVLTAVMLAEESDYNKWVQVIGSDSNFQIFLIGFQYVVYNILPIGLLCFFHRRAFEQEIKTKEKDDFSSFLESNGQRSQSQNHQTQ